MLGKLRKEDSYMLKGIAICAMLCHHLFYCDPAIVGMSFSGISYFIGEIGKFCVALFVMLSGYGLGTGFRNVEINSDHGFLPKIKHYVLHVIKRLVHFYLQYWPIFIIFVPIGVFVFHRPLTDAYGNSVNIVKRFVLDFCGVQGFNSYNITWWFNKLILLLYLLSPVYYLLIRKACIPSLAGFLLLLRFSDFIHCNLFNVDTYSLAFAIGIAISIYGCNILPVLQKSSPWILYISLLLLLGFSLVLRSQNWFQMGGTRADTLIALNLVLIVSSFESRILIKPLSFLGRHSANIYMTHSFINGYWFSTFIYSPRHPLIILGLSLLICITISILLEWMKSIAGVYRLQTIIDNKLSLL